MPFAISKPTPSNRETLIIQRFPNLNVAVLVQDGGAPVFRDDPLCFVLFACGIIFYANPITFIYPMDQCSRVEDILVALDYVVLSEL